MKCVIRIIHTMYILLFFFLVQHSLCILCVYSHFLPLVVRNKVCSNVESIDYTLKKNPLQSDRCENRLVSLTREY